MNTSKNFTKLFYNILMNAFSFHKYSYTFKLIKHDQNPKPFIKGLNLN